MNDPLPQFVQVGTSSVYQLAPDAGSGWVGYVLAEGTAPSAASLRLSDAFSSTVGGHYLFAATAPDLSDPAGFARSLYQYLRDIAGGGTFYGRVVLWMPDGAFPDTALFNQFALRIQGAGNSQAVVNNFGTYLSRNVTFYIASSCNIDWDDSRAAIAVTSSVGQTQTGFSDGTINNACGVSTSSGNTVWLALCGTHQGCFMGAAVMQPLKAISYFQIGLHYWACGHNGADIPLHYTLIDSASPQLPHSLPLIFTVDPMNRLDGGCRGTYPAGGIVRTGLFPSAAVGLPGLLVGHNGIAVTITPLRGANASGEPEAYAGGFVFSAQEIIPPHTMNTAQTALVPCGDWGVAISGDNAGTTRILCGFFGTEYCGCTTYDAGKTADDNDVVRWIPGMPAYAAVFPFGTASLDQPTSGALTSLLTSEYRTSWATMVCAASGAVKPYYSAQPNGSAFYAPDTQNTATTAILPNMAPVTEIPQSVDFCFPLAPYAGLEPNGDFSAQQIASFEADILAATRKRQFSSTCKTLRQKRHTARARIPKNDAATVWGTTPQGLLAATDTSDGMTHYDQIVLAQDQTHHLMSFENPSPALQEAFQTNQLFLVGVNGAEFGTPDSRARVQDGNALFHNTLNIADWTFVADVGNGVQLSDYQNVLILKYCQGTLRDRVKNPNRWTMADTFSRPAGQAENLKDISVTGLSQWLQDYIEEACIAAEKKQDSPYANFATLCQDENWNGFIVLRARLPLKSLPDQLAGLACGIKPDLFLAHHFGSTISQVSLTDGVLAIDGTSGLFGLVDYIDPQYAAMIANGGNADTPLPLSLQDGYAFSVLQLQSLFINAKMQSFSSKIQLSLESVLGGTIKTTTFGGVTQACNGVVLNGSAVQQNGTTVYVFEQNQQTVFTVDTAVLNAVTINRMQFNTLGVRSENWPSGTQDTVLSRFLIWGVLNFLCLTDKADKNFDILSFGNDAAENISDGLAFSNLQIMMNFPVATPAVLRFSDSVADLTFDLTCSTVRDGSLFKGFSLQLQNFIVADTKKMPADYGYLQVSASDLRLCTLTPGAWQGIVYKINMGTPGTLVSAAGFTSTLLVAWGTGASGAKDTLPVYIGLQLPGAAPNASMFSLQGVFKVSTGPIFLKQQTSPSQPDKAYFSLCLSNIGVKIFGISKLPPDATIQFFLFGDPDGNGSLGWYAAYVKKQSSSDHAALESVS